MFLDKTMNKNVIPVVAALITNSRGVLLAQRAKGNLVGTWEFPGGKVEEDESPFAAIEREIEEELGVKVKAIEEVEKFEHSYDFGLVSLTLIRCQLLPEDQQFRLDGSHSMVDYFDHQKTLNIQLAPLDSKIIDFLRL